MYLSLMRAKCSGAVLSNLKFLPMKISIQLKQTVNKKSDLIFELKLFRIAHRVGHPIFLQMEKRFDGVLPHSLLNKICFYLDTVTVSDTALGKDRIEFQNYQRCIFVIIP